MARTTATLKTLRRANDHEVIDDPTLRTHVNVDAAQALCPPGQPVVRQFWCAQAQPHVTGPGACGPTVMADGSDARLKAYGARHAHYCGSRPEARHQCEARVCVRMPPTGCPTQATRPLGEAAAQDAQAKDRTPRDGL